MSKEVAAIRRLAEKAQAKADSFHRKEMGSRTQKAKNKYRALRAVFDDEAHRLRRLADEAARAHAEVDDDEEKE